MKANLLSLLRGRAGISDRQWCGDCTGPTASSGLTGIRRPIRRTRPSASVSTSPIRRVSIPRLTACEDNPAYDAVTVEGSKRLMKGLQGFELEQFVFASTMLAHAPTEPGEPIDEDHPLDPRFPYRASKVRTEKVLREVRGDEKLVLMRPAGIYDDNGQSTFLTHQIARIHERRFSGKVYPGDLSRGQAFLHLDDFLDAVERIVDRRVKLPDVFPVLLGEADPIPFGELQRLIGRELHGEDWITWNVPSQLAKLGAWTENKVS